MNDEERHEVFKRLLKESDAAVKAITEHLLAEGWDVIVHPLRVAEKYEDRKKYSDCGDLHILNRIEVKHLNYTDFTSLTDPYFKLGIFIDGVAEFNAKIPKPVAYYIVNNSNTYAALALCKYSSSWRKHKGTHPQLQVEKICYYAPAEVCRLIQLRKE